MCQTLRTVTDQTFRAEVLQAAQPVLVDYWAPWCGPCRVLEPLIEQWASEYAGRLTLAKLNVDDSPATTTHYRIRSVPTLMLFLAGQPVATLVGLVNRGRLHTFVEAYV